MRRKTALSVYLGVNFASSIILLNSSLACISLFFFSFLSSSARVFTYWSNTWSGHNHRTMTERFLKMASTYNHNTVRKWKWVTECKLKLNLFPLFWVEQKITWVKHNLVKLFVPSRECRHLRGRQTTLALDRHPNINLYILKLPQETQWRLRLFTENWFWVYQGKFRQNITQSSYYCHNIFHKFVLPLSPTAFPWTGSSGLLAAL